MLETIEIKWEATTADHYNEMLSVLPPEYHEGTSFLLGEPMTHRECQISKQFAPVFDGFTYNAQGYLATSEAVTIKEFQALLENKLQPAPSH